MAYLKIKDAAGVERLLELGEHRVRAGRAHSNDLRLDDPAASREHFELRRQGDRYFIRDLGSRNGTLVNGAAVAGERALAPGDEIVVGSTSLLLVDGAVGEPVPADPLDAGTVIYEAEQLQRAFLAEAETAANRGAARNVFLLSEMARELMSITDERALCELIANRLLGVFACDRCAVVYRGRGDTAGGVDVMAIACAREGLSQEVRISTTAAHRVLEDKMSLVISDVFSDDRFRGQQSIMQGHITSILCAPLWLGDTVFGLLYLDTTGRLAPFDKTQLALLSTFANLAAIKIANLRMVADSIAKARMEQELALAAEIQAKMLPPRSFTFPGLACVGFNRPCFEVGGDYYDFRPFGEERCTVTVADVSGKGASGALLMASVKSMLTAFVDTGVPLLERTQRLNRYVIDNSTANRFVTFFHGEVDFSASLLRFCNAGHNPPLLVPPEGEPTSLAATGPILGMFDVRYTVDEAPFPEGCLLVAYSDGVTEATDAADEEFGVERLRELVVANRAARPEELRDAILAAVYAFTGGSAPQDDLTLLIVRREPA